MGTHSNDVCGRFSGANISFCLGGICTIPIQQAIDSRLFSVDFIIPSIPPCWQSGEVYVDVVTLHEKPGLDAWEIELNGKQWDRLVSIRTFIGIMFELGSDDAQADRVRMLARLLLFSVRACWALRKANRRPSSISCKKYQS